MVTNGKLTPDDVTSGSNRKVWWQCEEGHEWNAVVASRATGGHSCPYCSGLRVSDENRLSTLRPDMVDEWHPTKNGGLTPDDVAVASNRKVWWQCKEGHEWEAVVPSRTLNGNGCPYCAGQRVTDANRLSIKAPELIKEWHPTKNGDLTPGDVSYGSARKVWWICERGHEWEAAIHSRSDGIGCRSCSLPHRSRVEIYLACELAEFFEDIDPTRTHNITTSEGRSMDVDILIVSQNLVVEYDGAYWHRGKLATDHRKTEMLKAAGWNVLRIREEPLEPVQSGDLRCPVTYPNTSKTLADRVLIHLEEEFGIEIQGLAKYLASKSLVNKAIADEIMGAELSNRQRTASIRPDPALQPCLL